jgi:hypothetical protein
MDYQGSAAPPDEESIFTSNNSGPTSVDCPELYGASLESVPSPLSIGSEVDVGQPAEEGVWRETLFLACPFFKHDPRRFERVKDCCGPGWGTFSRVK